MRAAMLCLIAACSGDDARPMANQPVRVRVVTGEAPRAGVTVWVQDLDSRLVAETTTDENGEASAYLSGGYVTLLDPFMSVLEEPFLHQLYTIANVEAGDVLVAFTPSGPSTVPRMTITPPVHPNAATYAYAARCLDWVSPGAGVPLLFIGCESREDLVIIAESATGSPIA